MLGADWLGKSVGLSRVCVCVRLQVRVCGISHCRAGVPNTAWFSGHEKGRLLMKSLSVCQRTWMRRAGTKQTCRAVLHCGFCLQQHRVWPRCVWVPALVKAKPHPDVLSSCLLRSSTAVSPAAAHGSARNAGTEPFVGGGSGSGAGTAELCAGSATGAGQVCSGGESYLTRLSVSQHRGIYLTTLFRTRSVAWDMGLFSSTTL